MESNLSVLHGEVNQVIEKTKDEYVKKSVNHIIESYSNLSNN